MVKIWDITNGELLQDLEGHTSPVYSVAFSPNNQRLASGSADQTIRVWQLSTGVPLLTMREHVAPVNDLDYSTDGTRIASVSSDRTVRIWSAADGSLIDTYEGHTLNIVAVSFAPNSREIASWALDRSLRIWDIDNLENSIVLRDFASPVYALAVDPAAGTVAYGSIFHIGFWKFLGEQQFRVIDANVGAVRQIAYSANGQWVAVASSNGSVFLFDSITGYLLKEINMGGDLTSLTFANEDRVLLVTSSAGVATVWTVEELMALSTENGAEPTPAVTFSGHDGSVTDVAVSTTNKTVVTSGADGDILLWDMDNGQLIRRLGGHEGQVNAVTISEQGTLIASAGSDGTVRLWDAQLGTLLFVMEGHRGQVNDVAFSPNGELLASSGASDWSIIVWDTSSGNQQTTLLGHRDSVNSITFSSEGALLVSASSDGTVRLWAVIES